jgi:hypothetical protein
MAREEPQEMGQSHGYGRLSLKRREEARLGRRNQIAKTSTGVDARRRKWEAQGNSTTELYDSPTAIRGGRNHMGIVFDKKKPRQLKDVLRLR